MSDPESNAQYLKCPYCPCIFFTQADLDTHLEHFGNNAAQHIKDYKEVNTKIEYGSGSDE
jgi:uncharacterized C2H2 Zn-finger protein